MFKTVNETSVRENQQIIAVAFSSLKKAPVKEQ
jgi:hypothetical protein